MFRVLQEWGFATGLAPPLRSTPWGWPTRLITRGSSFHDERNQRRMGLCSLTPEWGRFAPLRFPHPLDRF